MRVSIFVGDIAGAPADALCTSTNPRLSLMMGTGASIREKGGWDVLRACEAHVKQQPLRAGSAVRTTAGALPCKAIIHCVASNEAHLTSPAIIQACVKNALQLAREADCRSVAMPVFGTGHARFKFDQALIAIRDALSSAPEGIEEVLVVIYDPARAEEAERLLLS